MPRARGRIGVRQERHGPKSSAPGAHSPRHHVGKRAFRRTGSPGAFGARNEPPPGRRHGHGIPGSHDKPEPHHARGRQIEEALREHERLSRSAARERVLDMLRLVGMPEPERRYAQYPHECSGGMRQRVLIAMALICHPRLIVADEPTTALDVTIQAQILDILKNLQSKLHTALLLITHDLGVVANMAHRIAVVYAGRIVETAPVRDLFARPSHPYTRRLLCSRPSLEGEAAREPLCAIEGTPPDLFAPPPGCGFAPRCDYAMAICGATPPPSLAAGPDHVSSCWLLHPQARERYGALMEAPLERRRP